MASPYKPELFTIESVMDFYHNADGCQFKVFGGTTAQPQFCRYIFDGEEKEIGMQKLEEALYGLKSNVDNTNPYLIQVYSNPKKKGDPANTTNIVFQLNKVERIMPYMAGMMPQQTDPEIKMLLSRLIESNNIMVTKLSQEEVEDDYEEPPTIQKALGSMLSNPEVQNNLLGLGVELIGSIIKRLNGDPLPAQNFNPPGGIAGVPEEESITILKSLMARGVTLEHLKKLNQMSDIKLSMLLNML
jgi:hypothetical protein